MQNKKILAVVAALSVTAGCSSQFDTENQIGNLPDSVVALAAPGQNLATARLVPQDNCYWYAHSGPVETTLVPLRATNGGPICVAREA